MPKEFNVEILPTAWEDLTHFGLLFTSICLELPTKVTKQILHILERMESYPESGSLTLDKWLNRKGYRVLISDRYVSIYRLIGKTVYVYHIPNIQAEYKTNF